MITLYRTVFTILLFTAFNVIASESLYTWSGRHYSISYEANKSAQYISFSGEILPSSDKTAIKKVVSLLTKDKNIFLEISYSNGGYARAFKQFSRALRDACPKNSETCKIQTFVSLYCGSACTTLYMVGDHRYADRIAHFRFHRTWIITPAFSITTAEKMVNEMIELGANPDFFNNHTDLFRGAQYDGKILDGDELVDSWITHDFIDKNSFRDKYNFENR